MRTNALAILWVASQRLAHTAREFDPGAAIVTARSCREALTTFEACDRLALAFVQAGPGRAGAARLLRDDAAEEAENNGMASRVWPVLMRPFSSQVVTTPLIACRRG